MKLWWLGLSLWASLVWFGCDRIFCAATKTNSLPGCLPAATEPPPSRYKDCPDKDPHNGCCVMQHGPYGDILACDAAVVR